MNARLHHVAIIVPNRQQVDVLTSLFGLQQGDEQYVPEYEADCYFTKGPGTSIEFIVPRGGKLSEFNRGLGGLHHIALEVDDLEEATRELGEKGVKLLEKVPVDAGSIHINFLPPIYTRGVLVEFVQRKERHEH
jgi:methylmalonyl-CoA epimerase